MPLCIAQIAVRDIGDELVVPRQQPAAITCVSMHARHDPAQRRDERAGSELSALEHTIDRFFTSLVPEA